MTSDIKLVIKQVPNSKNDKAWITINLGYNVIASYKLDLLFY